MPLTPEARQQAVDELRPRHLDWLRSVRGLISQPELDYFLRLEEDFRRDLFIRSFWEPRDPDRGTPQNELRERWERFRDSPGGPPYGDPRFMLLLLNGPPGAWKLPDGQPVGRCFSRSKELEIWFYGASERTEKRFPVILQKRSSSTPYEVYLPGQGVRPIQRSGGLPSTNIQELCAEDLLRYAQREILRLTGYDQLLREVLSPPLPSPEWLANLAASATDLPAGAETFEVGVELDFPNRKQSRTGVRMMLGVTLGAAPGQRFSGGEQTGDREGELFHHFQLVGEVIRDGQLFESFRYRFEGPTPEDATMVPLGFTRYLRAGPASIRLLLEDVYGGRFARVVREIEIPAPEGLPPVAAAVGEPEPAGRPALQLYPPPGNVHVGKVRFRANASIELDKVTFFLDDRPALSKRRPPYSVELDLGDVPEPHRVRVVGFKGDAEVATDQIWLNQGAQRFRVHLIEPRPGGIYPGQVTARVQVDTPDDKPPERLELYLGDEPAATLTEPPFEQRLTLPAGGVAVVRAVAYLADGTSTEDAVVVGAAAFTDVIDVRLVQVPVAVTDSRGEAITGLGKEQFRVFDDGVERRIERFGPAAEAPITTAVLIDRSISMAPHLEQVADAARAFAAAAARTSDDRVAVFSFADDLTVDAGFHADAGERERALAGLSALGGTALYDGLVRAFNTFEGQAGAPALVLFTDGRDETSRLTFEQALDAARRAGVRLYTIGLEAAVEEKSQRKTVEQLAGETGGRAIFLSGLENLSETYLAIFEEIRSGYLLAYQAPSAGTDPGFRKIKVEVDAAGARVRARSGYFP